jgi:DNA-directed RNA polymerase I and III subunit RPAC2
MEGNSNGLLESETNRGPQHGQPNEVRSKSPSSGWNVEVQENADRSEVVLTFRGEGHTLGNLLRYMIAREAQIDQVGYTIPHPSEDCMKLYVASKPGTRALDCVKLALVHLTQLCDMVGEKYEEAFAETTE